MGVNEFQVGERRCRAMGIAKGGRSNITTHRGFLRCEGDPSIKLGKEKTGFTP